MTDLAFGQLDKRLDTIEKAVSDIAKGMERLTRLEVERDNAKSLLDRCWNSIHALEREVEALKQHAAPKELIDALREEINAAKVREAPYKMAAEWLLRLAFGIFGFVGLFIYDKLTRG